LERVVAGLNEAKRRKEMKWLDDWERQWARTVGRPVWRKQKTEPTWMRRSRRVRQRIKHLKNVIKAYDEAARKRKQV
jgi:hypothetical protein